jgi:hypothetical protein
MLKLSLISLILIPLLGLSQSANAKLVFSDTHNLVKVLNAGMATAKRHVDLITPELKNDKLHKLLLKTSNRSVRIRIITNKTLASTRQAEALEKNHIDVRYAPINVQYGFAVIDGARTMDLTGKRARVITSVTGLGSADLQGAHKSMSISSKGFPLAQNYQEEFNYVWNHSKDHGNRARFARTSGSYRFNRIRGTFL